MGDAVEMVFFVKSLPGDEIASVWLVLFRMPQLCF